MMTDQPALPPLPEPSAAVIYNESKGYTWGAYTADQMREYARQALAQPAASGEPAEPQIDERAAFEKWLAPKLRNGGNLNRNAQGVYMDNRVAPKWAAWNARAALARTDGEYKTLLDRHNALAMNAARMRLELSERANAQPAPARVPALIDMETINAGWEKRNPEYHRCFYSFVAGVSFAEQHIGTPAKEAP